MNQTMKHIELLAELITANEDLAAAKQSAIEAHDRVARLSLEIKKMPAPPASLKNTLLAMAEACGNGVETPKQKPKTKKRKKAARRRTAGAVSWAAREQRMFEDGIWRALYRGGDYTRAAHKLSVGIFSSGVEKGFSHRFVWLSEDEYKKCKALVKSFRTKS